MSNINIIGAGLVSSLGLSKNESCSAYHAGISNISQYYYYPIQDSDDGTIQGLDCHQIESFTEGFYRIGRWIRLANGALSDLLESFEKKINCSGIKQVLSFYCRHLIIGMR